MEAKTTNPLAAGSAVAIGLRPSRELLKTTTTRCPTCHRALPGEVWREGAAPGRVVLRRTCPEHGEFEATLATDARLYWVSHGACGTSGCCQPANSSGHTGTLGRNAAGHEGAPFETLSTCLALIEMVRSCNLSCPACYASSPFSSSVDAVPLEELQQRVQGVIDRKGGIEILQLSGGEPTLHPQFFEFLEWAQAHERIDFVLLNTNGLRLAREPDFATQMRIAAARRGLQVYLQFDGLGEAGQQELRGGDLRAWRAQAIEVCRAIELPVTLAMTVTPANLGQVWSSIAFGLAQPHIQGITFQPLFRSGRVPATLAARTEAAGRLNAADILLAACEQSAGQLSLRDFTPLPCGDPNCAIIGYLLRLGGRVRSASEFLDFSQLQGFLRDRMNYRLEDLAQCGCETEPLGQLLHRLELHPGVAFRIVVKPFMDAASWDDDRIDRCCTHVIRPDGRLDSFCRYYSGFETQPAA